MPRSLDERAAPESSVRRSISATSRRISVRERGSRETQISEEVQAEELVVRSFLQPTTSRRTVRSLHPSARPASAPRQAKERHR